MHVIQTSMIAMSLLLAVRQVREVSNALVIEVIPEMEKNVQVCYFLLVLDL